MIHPDDCKVISRDIRKLYSKIRISDCNPGFDILRLNYRLRVKDGSYIKILTHSLLILPDKGGDNYICKNICTNITHIKNDNNINIILYYKQGEIYNTVYRGLNHNVQLLSKREKEIYNLLCQGMCSNSIADILFISKHTVDTHRRKIIKKLDLTNTTSLIVNTF